MRELLTALSSSKLSSLGSQDTCSPASPSFLLTTPSLPFENTDILLGSVCSPVLKTLSLVMSSPPRLPCHHSHAWLPNVLPPVHLPVCQKLYPWLFDMTTARNLGVDLGPSVLLAVQSTDSTFWCLLNPPSLPTPPYTYVVHLACPLPWSM